MSWFGRKNDNQASELQDYKGQVAAIGRSKAVIEFALDGKILTANESFLKTMGYALEEIRGQHHGIFVDPAYRRSPDYRMFWEKLGRGENEAGEFKEIGKGGKEIWLQASYYCHPRCRGQVVQGREIRDRHHGAETAQRQF